MPKKHKRGKILIVDDNPACCDLLVATLEDNNYEARSTTDAEEAYEIVDSFQPDLLLLDINMPQIDGIDLLMLLRGYSTARSRPVVFVSALPKEKMEQQCLEMGASDYIEKPFSVEKVITTVRKHMPAIHG